MNFRTSLQERIMSNYYTELLEEGMVETRARRLRDAMGELHSAIMAMDDTNLNIFLSKPLTKRFDDYCKAEGLRRLTQYQE